MSGSSIVKTGLALSATLTIIALSMSGCALTAKPPAVAAADPGFRPTSAAQAMQQADPAKRVAETGNNPGSFVDPMVSARPGTGVRDFRASGRSAATTMRSNGAAAANRMPNVASPSASDTGPAAMTPSAMTNIVTQPTGIQAGRNSIFSASAAPSDEPATAAESMSPARRTAGATGSLSADAVAYAPVRRISGATGGLFAGGPQMAQNTSDATEAAGPARPGIASHPSVPPAAEPVAQGLW